MGEVIERAVNLLSDATPGAVRLDALIAGLLDVRFEVRTDDRGFWLYGERELAEPTRTLLGKPTQCVGRDRELAVLESLFDECRDEPVARAAVIVGPSGIGKSRLRYEFLRSVQKRHEVELLVGRGDPMSAGSPFGMIAWPLRQAAGVRSGEPAALQQKKLRARIGRHVEASSVGRVAEFIGELVGVPFPDEESLALRAAREDPILMGDQMRRASVDFLRAECGAQPVLLVFEDLHWGDLPSVKLVDEALRALRDQPFMVVALARPEVYAMFPKLWADREAQEVRLGALTRKGSERLVRQVLGEGANPRTIERLVTQAAGNAFYLEELIRAVAEGKGEELPATVLAMIQGRLDALDLEVRRVLRAASIFGQVFWKSGVDALLGGGRSATLEDWLALLVEREFITSRGEGRFPDEPEFVFRHALVREASYAMLTSADRTLGHRLAGRWLEAAGEVEALSLAEHYERGGDSARAMRWYARAAEQALGGDDYAAVVDRAERSFRCGELSRKTSDGSSAPVVVSDDAFGALRLLQAEAFNWSGEQPKAEAAGLDAMRIAPAGSRAFCDAAAQVAVAAGKLGHTEKLVEIAEALREIAARDLEPQTRQRHVLACVRASTPLRLAGKVELADELLGIAERFASTEPATSGLLNEALGLRALFEGDPGTYLVHSGAAVRSFEQAGDRRVATIPRVNIGAVCMEIGAYADGERALREALAAAEAMGLSSIRVAARANLALALARQGKLTEARELIELALRDAESQTDRRIEAATRAYFATILTLSGDFDDAERHATTASELVSAAVPLRAQVLATLAQVELALEKPQQALVAARDAMRILETTGGIEEGESLIRLAYAEALAFSGQHEEANDAIVAARDRLLERASRIRDLTWRRSFLEGVSENARTIALARAWTAESIS
jgi:tetratricopeptide (TPR) repeat protein